MEDIQGVHVEIDDLLYEGVKIEKVLTTLRNKELADYAYLKNIKQ